MKSSNLTTFPIICLCVGIATITTGCEKSMVFGTCAISCPSGFVCGPDGGCHKPCNLTPECDVCEMCSDGLCLPKVGCTEGNEQPCSQDKTCENPNQICVNNNGELVCADNTELRFRPGSFGSTQLDWEAKEYVIDGDIAAIVGTSYSDHYTVHPNTN